MKSFYSKTFAKYSPFFPVLMILILVFAYILRAKIAYPIGISQNQINLFGRFGFSTTFITENIYLLYKIEFWISLLSIVAAFFLGMSLIGKTSGLFIAMFLGLYPSYIANTYSVQTITIFFFILYLYFQLQATIEYSKVFSAISGVFFMLAFICNPVCLLLGPVMYIYQGIHSKNLIALINFLLFLGGALVTYIIYAIVMSRFPDSAIYMTSFITTFSEFGKNFEIFCAKPLDYIKNVIAPLFTETLAYPKTYSAEIGGLKYIHYFAISSAVFGLFYALIEEKALILTILSAIVLVQAFFITIDFGFLFLFIIMIASYLIDKVFNEVFCQ